MDDGKPADASAGKQPEAPAPLSPHPLLEAAILLGEMSELIELAGDNAIDRRELGVLAERARSLLDEIIGPRYQEEEPLFILRGRDKFAQSAVLHWVTAAYAGGVGREKIQSALRVAAAMDQWHGRRVPD